MPCISGSKGGCWAPYTCWMLFKTKENTISFSSAFPKAHPQLGKTSSWKPTCLREATLHQLPQVALQPPRSPEGPSPRYEWAIQAHLPQTSRAFSPPCKWASAQPPRSAALTASHMPRAPTSDRAAWSWQHSEPANALTLKCPSGDSSSTTLIKYLFYSKTYLKSLMLIRVNLENR